MTTHVEVMERFFTSDHHFGHRNISRLAGRPFPDTAEGVEEMNEAMVRGWNETVGPDDLVAVLGDFALGKIAESLQMLGRLNGSKYLIAGNHDRCWRGHKGYSEEKVEEWKTKYLEAGFDHVVESGILGTEKIVAVTPNRQSVNMHHFPYAGDSHAYEDRYADRRPRDDGGWLIHGHVHEAWRQRGRQINVGVDAWNGRPVPESVIAEMIAAGPDDLGPLAWTP